MISKKLYDLKYFFGFSKYFGIVPYRLPGGNSFLEQEREPEQQAQLTNDTESESNW